MTGESMQNEERDGERLRAGDTVLVPATVGAVETAGGVFVEINTLGGSVFVRVSQQNIARIKRRSIRVGDTVRGPLPLDEDGVVLAIYESSRYAWVKKSTWPSPISVPLASLERV